MRLKKEQDEKELKRKEKAEAHLYTTIKVVTLSFFYFDPFTLYDIGMHN